MPIPAVSTKYHYLYKITNNLNGKFYIGRHSSNVHPDESDYWGSGVALLRAYKVHGKHNFTKEVIQFCDTFESLCDLESTIVNKEFINRQDTYNMTVGGYFGGVHSSGVMSEVNNRPEKVKRQSESMKARLSTKESRVAHSLNMAKGNTPVVKSRKSETMKSKTNRPWLVAKQRSNLNYMLPYFNRLDEVYDLILTIEGWENYIPTTLAARLEPLVKQLFGVYYSGQSTCRYFQTHGDPRLDPLWLSFRDSYLTNSL